MLLEYENIINNDYRTKAIPKISWLFMSSMDKFMIFMSLLAEKLNYNIWDFL